MGAGNIQGKPYHDFSTWLDMYNTNIGMQVQMQK
jgi:hypothetical protein